MPLFKHSSSYNFWIFVFLTNLCSTHLKKKHNFDHGIVRSMLLVYLLKLNFFQMSLPWGKKVYTLEQGFFYWSDKSILELGDGDSYTTL